VKERGQAMTEFTIILPLLLLMFIGVVEVGWAIRGYMVLLQASREAARYATRQDVADLWGEDDDQAYRLVFSHFRVAGGFDNATIIIHRYEAYTGKTCTSIPCNSSCATEDISDNSSDFFVSQDGITRTSRFNDQSRLDRLMRENHELNCEKELRYYQMCLNWPGETQDSCKQLTLANVNTDFDNDSVLIEAFYDQPMLTRFRKIPLWVYTQMRIP
jgi:hypothetical protein